MQKLPQPNSPFQPRDIPLLCPFCEPGATGSAFIHLGPICVLQNDDCIHVGYEDGAPKLDHHIEPAGANFRGSRIVVRLFGECGHRFCTILDFYKGTVHQRFQRVHGPRCGFDDPEKPIAELWRD